MIESWLHWQSASAYLCGTNSLFASTEIRVAKRQLCCRVVEFLVYNSTHELICIQPDRVHRVGNGDEDRTILFYMVFQNLKTVC